MESMEEVASATTQEAVPSLEWEYRMRFSCEHFLASSRYLTLSMGFLWRRCWALHSGELRLIWRMRQLRIRGGGPPIVHASAAPRSLPHCGVYPVRVVLFHAQQYNVGVGAQLSRRAFAACRPKMFWNLGCLESCGHG